MQVEGGAGGPFLDAKAVISEALRHFAGVDGALEDYALDGLVECSQGRRVPLRQQQHA